MYNLIYNIQLYEHTVNYTKDVSHKRRLNDNRTRTEWIRLS